MALATTSVTINTDVGTPGRDTMPGSSRWWDRPLLDEESAEGEERVVQVHGDLVPYVRSLMVAWAKHEWMDRFHDRVYENRSLLGMRKAAQALQNVGFNPSRMMVTTSIVDTFHARFEKRRPMPMLVVDDADYAMKQQASEFQSLLRGKMREKDVDHVSSRNLKDALVRGNGIAYIDEGEDDIIVERVNRWELFVDPHEAAASAGGTNDAVRQKHRVRRVAREVLLAEYPEHASAIRSAPPAQSRQYEGADEWCSPVGGLSSDEMVDLYESWHLPSCAYCEDDADEDDAIDDGRHAVCIENATLCLERWRRPRFPFAILRAFPRQDGYWGQGIVERLAEDQADVNRIARDIQRNVEVNGNLIVFTPAAMDNIPTEKLTGRGPMRVKYAGTQAPAYVAPSPVTPAHLGYLDSRIAKMHDFSGVSQWSAQGRSPVGAGASGVAIDTMEDLQSDRHSSFEAAYSRFRCEVGQLILDACRAVALRKREERKEHGRKAPKYGATWMEHGTLRRLEWDTVALDEECYRIEIEPVSFVPATRAGKLGAIKELSQLPGVWTPEQMLELFDEPDLAGATRESLAQIKLGRHVMRILGDPSKEAPMPEPEWELAIHKRMAQAYIALAIVDHAPDEVVTRYRDYLTAVLDTMGKGTQPAPPVDPDALGVAGPPGPMGPPGMPMDPSMMPPMADPAMAGGPPLPMPPMPS